ncbi:MAG TPA: hypothetical protein VGK10_08040, partial [Prolixibacteraceae bacterium]
GGTLPFYIAFNSNKLGYKHLGIGQIFFSQQVLFKLTNRNLGNHKLPVVSFIAIFFLISTT